jgi:6,7-dimethyl-8-ribityllumazine synthase
VRTLEGSRDGSALRVAVVASRFDKSGGGIVSALCSGAVDAARELGVPEDAVDVVWVPGAFELPLAAQHLAETGRYDAIACVGAVVRGETAHFDFVAGGAARGVMDVGREFGLPVTFGVVTTDTVEQAQARAGGNVRNSGREAMIAAIELANLLRQVDALDGPREE